jgi:hypothetical protein
MKLVQRREVWLPTPWGWLALLSAAAGLAIALVASLYPFLAVTDPAGGARVLVVEGWLGPHELDEALAILHRGRYARVLTTGGPLHTWPESAPDATYAHRAADYLKRHGAIGVTPVPSPITANDRTYFSALKVREWLIAHSEPVDAIDVVSQGPHARRSRLLYERAFGPALHIGVFATGVSDYDAAVWWRSSAGARDVWDQATGLVWVRLFFRPSGDRLPDQHAGAAAAGSPPPARRADRAPSG